MKKPSGSSTVFTWASPAAMSFTGIWLAGRLDALDGEGPGHRLGRGGLVDGLPAQPVRTTAPPAKVMSDTSVTARAMPLAVDDAGDGPAGRAPDLDDGRVTGRRGDGDGFGERLRRRPWPRCSTAVLGFRPRRPRCSPRWSARPAAGAGPPSGRVGSPPSQPSAGERRADHAEVDRAGLADGDVVLVAGEGEAVGDAEAQAAAAGVDLVSLGVGAADAGVDAGRADCSTSG